MQHKILERIPHKEKYILKYQSMFRTQENITQNTTPRSTLGKIEHKISERVPHAENKT